MISVQVVVKDPGTGRWANEGKHHFRLLPRIGEWIVLTRNGVSCAYEVVGINHLAQPSGVIYCFIFTVRNGTLEEAMTRLLEESPDAR